MCVIFTIKFFRFEPVVCTTENYDLIDTSSLLKFLQPDIEASLHANLPKGQENKTTSIFSVLFQPKTSERRDTKYRHLRWLTVILGHPVPDILLQFFTVICNFV